MTLRRTAARLPALSRALKRQKPNLSAARSQPIRAALASAGVEFISENRGRSCVLACT
jgi:hypothetical protein